MSSVVALMFCSQPTPTQAGNHISNTVHSSPARAVLVFRSGITIPQIAATLGTGAVEVLGHSIPSRRQTLVHHDPSKLQPAPAPFRQFFDAHGEPLKLKAGDFHD
jgi:hypothetical protein